MAWNEASIAVLRKLYALGVPTRIIAAELGMTKNMVIGKAGRLGLEHPNSTSPVPIYRPPYRDIETPDFRHCQYPIGNVGEPGFRFCGDPAKIRSSYCEAHHAKCYRVLQDRDGSIVHVSKSPFSRLHW
jgi:GcrA cell cycle regulator